jgi:hypothetical protein
MKRGSMFLGSALGKVEMPEPTELTDTFTDAPSQISTLASLKRASRWLGKFASSVTSQNGEDGIVAKALSLLPDLNHWCVEFGAWDGRHFSNTYDLVDRHGYSVVLIEGNAVKYRQLCSNYAHRDRSIVLNAYVGWTPEDGLDHLLRPHPIPRNPDFLSVDIDGNAYHVWDAMKEFKPKLVLIEYNWTMPNAVQFVQPADASCHQGSSPAALVTLAKTKGYELISATKLNLLFVDRDYYSKFGIRDNSLDVILDEEPTHLFFGYDGTVFLSGGRRLPWHHGFQLSDRKLQALPRMVRKFPSTYSLIEKCVFAILLLWNSPVDGWKSVRHYLETRRR